MNKNTFIFYCPFTGLGNYGGFRGNRWLRNRIQIFKQFTLPSLLNQTDRDFLHWISWRPEERRNKYVQELHDYLSKIPNYKFIFTYTGIAFWDDKLEDSVARERLSTSLRLAVPELINVIGDGDVYMMLSPSDDCYDKMTVESTRLGFQNEGIWALSYTKGYLCNYNTKEVLEYNPKTNPPFFVIKFTKDIFIDIAKHLAHISLKEDMNQYKKGTPYPSHEYISKCLPTGYFDGRGFLVGTHGENISTHFNHPYGGQKVDDKILMRFGLDGVEPLKLPISIRKQILRRLPYKVQRKLRYWFGELMFNKLYNYLRN